MTFWQNVHRVLTLSCDQASELISAACDRPLSRPERLALRLHLLGCRFCRRYRRQLQWLRNMLRRLGSVAQPDAGPGDRRLSDDAGQRISDVIRRHLDTDAS